jgi:hypothetical protein
MTNKISTLKSNCLIILITLGFYTFALAANSDTTNCMQFVNNPDLFKECQNNINTTMMITPPKKPKEKKDEKSCSICDTRQRRRVKKLLEKKKK